MTELIITAFVLGFLGSFHCAGMCGPLALALPGNGLGIKGKMLTGVLYNSGRGITYLFIGLITGITGQVVALSGYQSLFSISIGALILISLGFHFLFKRDLISSALLIKATSGIRTRLSKLFSSRSMKSIFYIGILNGFLPCGLVYLAAAGSLASGGITGGLAFMGAFALGTFPMMFLISISSGFISHNLKNRFLKAVPVFMGLIGVLLVLRGLNLDIPYLSPSTGSGKIHHCCRKE